ncbi:hypothetical protein [Caulobacter sp. DWR1-3-2b1]|uniref:hypothetical protein n=1 Tax=Caulobacter sp. DWR1-3-2b1 TaxID=2804670 RepID=UPI003CF852C7
MFIKTIATGAALTLAIAASASAQTTAKRNTMIGPKAPIPYGQLKAYSNASAKTRASKDWWQDSAAASTGAAVDTSATAPMPTGTLSGDAKASTSTDMMVNPSSSMPATPPIQPGSSVSPEPGSNLPGSTPDMPPPTPK